MSLSKRNRFTNAPRETIKQEDTKDEKKKAELRAQLAKQQQATKKVRGAVGGGRRRAAPKRRSGGCDPNDPMCF